MLLFAGTYHYHQNPVCLGGTQTDKLIGVALDGFPIYGNKVQAYIIIVIRVLLISNILGSGQAPKCRHCHKWHRCPSWSHCALSHAASLPVKVYRYSGNKGLC